MDIIFLTVGMVKQPTPETSEFTMSNEDFPALPGSQANPTGKSKWRSLGQGKKVMMNMKILGKNSMPFYHYPLTERKSSRRFQMMASQITRRSPTLHLARTLHQIWC